MTSTWPFRALLSASFPKIGVAGLPSDEVTALRTVVVLAVIVAAVFPGGRLSAATRAGGMQVAAGAVPVALKP